MPRTCDRCGAEETNEKYIKNVTPYITKEFLCLDCVDKDMEDEPDLFSQGKWMGNQCKGQEVWTFHTDLEEIIGVDGRVCVGISDTLEIMYNGEKFKITEEIAEDLWKDIIYQEYGTNDMKRIMEMEGFEL